jgi:hypothetical protein
VVTFVASMLLRYGRGTTPAVAHWALMALSFAFLAIGARVELQRRRARPDGDTIE